MSQTGHDVDARPQQTLGAVVVALLYVLALAACSSTAARIEGFKAGRLQTRATADLKRGMNFGDAMDAPNEGDWGWTLSASDFAAVRAAGFDHVRVPMRISSHADAKPPYAIEKRFLHRMDWAVDQALSNDLGIIVDMHHYQPMMAAPKVHADRLVGLWRQIAAHYRGMPRAVVYEVLNEPTDKLTAEVWNPILARVVAAIRAIDPERVIIVEGAHWASAKDLRDTLQVPTGDPNIVASFHMYAPMYFTHQGFSWMEPWYQTRGVTFPGPPAAPVAPVAAADAHAEGHDFFQRYNSEPEATNPGGPAAIIEQMEMAEAFAKRTGMRVYLGEFGAGVNADVASRGRWVRTARTEAEKRGFGWGYWDFCRNFAAYAQLGFAGKWIPEIRAALLD
ncbi:MAG TPA: glycoside hydrolase family 5 protein [Polyangia bacterium]|jgi:endoglucanase|nr:glycoside hydrolase family 5 protein [Polyangia bacterium]